MTLEEREQIKAEILEEIRTEKKGTLAWRKYLKDELRPKIKSIVPPDNIHYKYDANKLQQSLSQFVMVVLNKNVLSIKENEIDKVEKIVGIFIKAYKEAQEISR